MGLTGRKRPAKNLLPNGAVAQLEERLNGIQKAVGSIPSSSTNEIKDLAYTS
jgi:hypothetical protein